MDKEIKVINLMADKVLIVVGQDGSISSYRNNESHKYYLLEVPISMKAEEFPLEEIKILAKEALNNYELIIKQHIEHLFDKYQLDEIRISKKHFADKCSEFYRYRVLPSDVKSLLEDKWGLEYQKPSRIKYPTGFNKQGEITFEEQIQRCYIVRREQELSK